MMTTTNNTPETDTINTNWIILDIRSTISSIIDRHLVQDIHSCDAGEEFQAYTNRVYQDSNYTVTMKIIPFEFFYKENSLSNILPFSTAVCQFRITIDIYLDPYISMHFDDRTSIIIKQCSGGGIFLWHN